MVGFAAYDLRSDYPSIGGCVVIILGNEFRPLGRSEPGGLVFVPDKRVQCADLRPIRRSAIVVARNYLSCAAQKPLMLRICTVARKRLRDFVRKSLPGMRHQSLPNPISGT